MLISMVPPHNDCGGRIVMYRHLVERKPFELHVASQADFDDDLHIHTRLRLPWLVQKIRKSRFGPVLKRWIHDFENLIWPVLGSRQLERAVEKFKPDVILTLAETGLCHIAAKLAKRRGIPLAGLFLDWCPFMEGHFGHRWTKSILNSRFYNLYRQCNLAICTSDGMKEVLGAHPNSHVVYPMPGQHRIPTKVYPPKSSKFRLVYVGNAQIFYGRMLRSLMREMEVHPDLELILVGPHGDWPQEDQDFAKKSGICLGFMAPDRAAEVIAGADALLVVMSFEKEHELFMRTSFTTKFLDYSQFGKPILIWGPEYCCPVKLAESNDCAVLIKKPDANEVVKTIKKLKKNPKRKTKYTDAAKKLYFKKFDPNRLQKIFVSKIKKLKNQKSKPEKKPRKLSSE